MLSQRNSVADERQNSVQQLSIAGKSAEKLSTIGESWTPPACPPSPICLDLHQTQKQQDEILDWTHVLISLKENLSTW